MHSPLLLEIPEEIDGIRVHLRPYRPEDITQVWEAIQESWAHLEPWLPWVHPGLSLDDERIFLVQARVRWLLREALPMAIFQRDSDRYLGGVGIQHIDWRLRSFEIGYWLRRTAEGQGFMRESVQLTTRLAFDVLKANRVEIRMAPRNLRSRNVAKKLGYVLEGTLRGSALGTDGLPADSHVFALMPREYHRLEWVVGEA